MGKCTNKFMKSVGIKGAATAAKEDEENFSIIILKTRMRRE